MTGALADLRVIDFTRVMSGPICTMILADLGADVVKVEPIGAEDALRSVGGYKRAEETAIFLSLNRGKRSLSVNLREPEGVALVKKLVATADVFVENWRPGVCDTIGIGPDALHEVNPALLYVSINGYGSDSPAAQEPAYDNIIQGRAGVVNRQRRGPAGRPDTVRSMIADKLSGFMAVQAILAALLERAHGVPRTRIELPMLDAVIYYAFADGLPDIAFIGDGVTKGVIFPLVDNYMSETADGYLVRMGLTPRERVAMMRAVGRDDMATDDRYTTQHGFTQPENYQAYVEAIAEAMKKLPTETALRRLREEGVPAYGLATPEDLLVDEHVVAEGVFREYEHLAAGRVRYPKYPIKVDGEVKAEGDNRPSPVLGQHTRDILREVNLDEDTIDKLVDSGVVRQADG